MKSLIPVTVIGNCSCNTYPIIIDKNDNDLFKKWFLNIYYRLLKEVRNQIYYKYQILKYNLIMVQIILNEDSFEKELSLIFLDKSNNEIN